ncbi:MAG: hypothetical protein LAN37_10520 [Acidobacteriia bacterium]|nr:hypothetical protein [Terriglobia bacterium]
MLLNALLVIALLVPSVAVAQHECAELQEAKNATYGFLPSRLNKAEQESKSKQMDVFWNAVRSTGTNGIACLRRMIVDEKKDGFFLFDASSLLYGIDKSPDSVAAIESGLERADLNQVDPGGYLSLLIQMSKTDVDTGPLAERYLRHPNVLAVVPQHAMTIDRSIGAVLLYGSMRADLPDKYLIADLNDKEPYVRATAALVLAINMTGESFRALQSVPVDSLPADIATQVRGFRTYEKKGIPLPPSKFSREQVLRILHRIPHTREEYEAVVNSPEYKAYQEAKYARLSTSKNAPTEESVKQMMQDREEEEPFTDISGAKRFIESAILTLDGSDLPLLRECRRKSIHGMSDEVLYEYFAYTGIIGGIINRLDLYKEYRIHPAAEAAPSK